MFHRSVAVLASLAIVAVAANAAAPATADLIIRNANVVDVRAGTVDADRSVAIRDGVIVDVGSDADVSMRWQAPSQINARGDYVMPGLWDMHVHFGGQRLEAENRELLPLYLVNGVTTIRDCSDDLPDMVLGWRLPLQRNYMVGPQLFSSGAKLEGIDPIWTGTLQVGDREQVRVALKKLQHDHVDFVKITDSTIKPDVFLYAVEEAKKDGFRTSAHIPLGVTVEDAVNAGLTSIEHVVYLEKMGSTEEQQVVDDYNAGKISSQEAWARLQASFSPKLALQKYRWLAQKGVFVTPTLYEFKVTALLDKDNHLKDPERQLVGPGLWETWQWRVERATDQGEKGFADARAQVAVLERIIPLLQEAGVKVMAGTDAGFLNSFIYPGYSLHSEIELYQAAGMTPANVLRAVTETGPQFFGLADKYGEVGDGYKADLLILGANPLKDIRNARKIDYVLARGNVYSASDLAAMTRQIRSQVAAWDTAAAKFTSDIDLWKVEGHATAIGRAEEYAAKER